MEIIKTTLQKALTAFKTINSIGKKVKGYDALKVFQLKNMLKEPISFMTEEEEKLVEKCGGTITDEAVIVIPDEKQRDKFIKAHKELERMEYEIKTEPVTISLDSNQDITLEEIEMLEGFINFV